MPLWINELSYLYFQRYIRSSKRNFLILGAVIGVVFFLVVAGVSVGTFYLGMQAEQKSVKVQAWVPFYQWFSIDVRFVTLITTLKDFDL